MSDDFDPHRSFLVGMAYRMLGSLAEAEDVVQDAFLRWTDTDRAAVTHPRAYLARVVSRLCLDRMKSAASRREQYVGTWLPEPLVAGPAEPLAEDLSVALLLTLERLSPLERAAFLLHDVFDMDYSAIADTLGRTEAACRQLAARAREHVRDERPRFTASDETRAKLTDAFQAAMTTGDIETISRLLAEDAIFYSDGGGKRLAALNPIYGKEKILRFMAGLASKRPMPQPEQVERVQINGLPGFVLRTSEGIETIALEFAGEQIVAIYAVRNPDKLRHLA
ncbi:MAG TPA: sigma-70 family RNA polymerase sigma factor [Kofleriaceae bacterium]|nr:sigma-70 family RNA polymerase sigma factor [Kofleriaceae bacterium]